MDQPCQQGRNHVGYPLSNTPDSNAGCLNVPSHRMQAFQLGYIMGQVTVYCEQVNAGAKLAAQFSFQREYREHVLERLKQERCSFLEDEQGGTNLCLGVQVSVR